LAFLDRELRVDDMNAIVPRRAGATATARELLRRVRLAESLGK
jgi:hypothetical protein